MGRHHPFRSPARSSNPADSWRIEPSNPRGRDVGTVVPGEWFARPDARQAFRSLPDVRTVRIEVNGCLAGAAECLAEATREFAVGWAFMHRFYSASDQIGSVSGSSGRVAIMVDSGENIDRRRLETVGWMSGDDVDADSISASMRPPRSVPFLSQHDAIALSERVFARFDVDGRASGLACAALARGGDLIVIARDVAPRGAVAKILGWMMTEDTGDTGSILIITGLIDDVMIEAACRAGIGVLISDVEPTAAAVRRATAQGTTVLGLVMSHRRAFFADGGHVGDDIEAGSAMDSIPGGAEDGKGDGAG